MQATHSPSASNPEFNSIVASTYQLLVREMTTTLPPVLVADALDVAVDVLAARVHEHTSSIRKQENAMRPFYTLPTELHILVAHYALANLHFRIRTLVALTSVSRRLREALISEPSLWKSVELEAPKHMVSLALQRSHPHCVELTVDGWEETSDEERSESPLLQEVLAQPARLKSVCFTILPKSYSRIPPLTGDVFPHLTSFSIIIVPDRPGGSLVRPLQPISLVGPPPPNLRRLRIDGLTLELIPSVWDTLERLSLSDTGITTSAILEVLGRCRQLRHLEVRGEVVVSPLPDDHPAVTSESITSITFDGKSTQFLPDLLPFVNLPNCRSFFAFLGPESTGSPSPNAVAVFAYASAVMLPHHSIDHQHTLSANIHNNPFMLSLDRTNLKDEPRYRLGLFIPVTYRSLPDWIGHLLHLNPLFYGCASRIALNVPIPYDEDDKEDREYEYHESEDDGSRGEGEGCDYEETSHHPFLTLKRLFRIRLDSLSIYGASPFGIYRAMSQPLSDGEWLLPRVRTLSIVGPAQVDLSPALDLLRARYSPMGFPGGPHPFSFIQLPPQLRGSHWVEDILQITGHSTIVDFNPS